MKLVAGESGEKIFYVTPKLILLFRQREKNDASLTRKFIRQIAKHTRKGRRECRFVLEREFAGKRVSTARNSAAAGSEKGEVKNGDRTVAG